MPVVAESPPLVFGGTPVPTKTPKPTITPVPTVGPTPVPSGTPTSGITQFVARHGEFITRINELGSCFKQEDLTVTGYTDQEFRDHSQIAMQDQYLTKERDLYCSMQGIRTLTEQLKRLGEE